MDSSGALRTIDATLRAPTPVRVSFPSAGFWMAIVILTMTIREVTLWQVGAAHGRIGDMVLLLVFGLWFGGRCLIGRFAIVRNRLDLAVMIFLMVYVVSILWADNVEAGWFRLLKLLRNGALYILLVDYLSANFQGRYQRIAVSILLAGLFQSLAFMVSISREGGLVALSTLLQADAIMSSNPLLNVVRKDQGAGLFMKGVASWLPLCMFIGLSIGPWIRSRGLAIGNWALFLAMGALTLLSATRASMVGLAVGFAIAFFFLLPRMSVKNMLVGAIIFLFPIILGTWYFGLHKLILGRFSFEVLGSDDAVSLRLEFFEYALARFAESPLIGAGVSSIDPDSFLVVHNVYLQVLGELGIVGGAVFLWIMALWVWYLMAARRMTSHMRDPLISRVAVSLLGFSGFLFTYFLVGHDLGSGEPWIVMSMASALHNSRPKVSSKSTN